MQMCTLGTFPLDCLTLRELERTPHFHPSCTMQAPYLQFPKMNIRPSPTTLQGPSATLQCNINYRLRAPSFNVQRPLLLYPSHRNPQIRAASGANSSPRSGSSSPRNPKSAPSGMPSSTKPSKKETKIEPKKETSEKVPSSIQSFPWAALAQTAALRTIQLMWDTSKWVIIPFAFVSVAAELLYALKEGMGIFVIIGLVMGSALAGVLHELVLDVTGVQKAASPPWHLAFVALAFALLKAPFPALPPFARAFLPFLANGALWQVGLITFRSQQKRASTTASG
eukprot:TRINITY_DN198_c0_g1_i1.p1 TRINITY_DN198_c0_g1~~TRINITY_DN198_c0_g1_i1.p1  ORF type:complete len:282 (+),score=32.38 TRINITY_DN198_c0_g1_i1:191-1036(+)